jgi:cardiolipin hydrolase
MHHKFVLLDEILVLTGSYNWTLASEKRNHENLLILKEPRVLESYRSEFEELWTRAEAGRRADLRF